MCPKIYPDIAHSQLVSVIVIEQSQHEILRKWADFVRIDLNFLFRKKYRKFWEKKCVFSIYLIQALKNESSTRGG